MKAPGLSEVSRIDKFTENESKVDVARGWGERAVIA